MNACSSDAKNNTGEDETTTNDQKKNVTTNRNRPPVINIGELSKMSKDELRLARNSIFAKYGRVFKSKDLQEYFSKQSWYKERPAFKESQMNKSDIALVQLIQLWEQKTEVLWRKDVDITGNGRVENCFVLYNDKKGTFSVVINDFSQEFDHYWGQNNDDQKPSDWTKINVSTVDIDPNDGRQEIHVSQRFDDWEDPGTHNVIIAFKNGVKVTELSSTDYNSGILSFNGDGTVTMQQSYCPEHIKEFRLEKGTLTEFKEKIGPVPPGGCAACFTGETMVAISETESIRFDELKRGDKVLTFDMDRGICKTTTIKRILEVYHEDIFALTINGAIINVTSDHPFLTENGWASLEPEKTMERYGYDNVTRLTSSSKLKSIDGDHKSIQDIQQLPSGQLTYTLESLTEGSNFIVHGLVVGTESRVRLIP